MMGWILCFNCSIEVARDWHGWCDICNLIGRIIDRKWYSEKIMRETGSREPVGIEKLGSKLTYLFAIKWLS